MSGDTLHFLLDDLTRFSQPRLHHNDLNPGLGKKAHSLGLSSPLSDLQSQGQPAREALVKLEVSNHEKVSDFSARGDL